LSSWSVRGGGRARTAPSGRRYRRCRCDAARPARQGQALALGTGPEPEQSERLAHDEDDTTEVVISSLTYAGIGWRTTAGTLLANTAAAHARERRRTGREELTTTTA